MKEKSSNFIAFDIGSSKIVALATNISKQGLLKINSQILQHSEGFKSGIITNMQLAEKSIVGVIYALEKECNKSIKEIAISLSGTGVKSYYITHKIKVGNHPISKRDIKKLINKALLDFKVKEQKIIHYLPMEFIIDDKQSIENPVEMYARELSCQLHIISVDSLMLMNLTRCLAKCHLEVSDVIVSIYASGIACLDDDEKELGSIIIDIGSNITSFGIFLNGKIIYVNHIAIGSDDITTDIAKRFSVSLRTADKLKILYGNVNPNLLIKDTTIKLDKIDPDNSYDSDLSISASNLSEIINLKIKDIFLKIKKQCDHISMDHLLARRIVITGGGAALPGIKNLASNIFQKQVRIAKPENLPGFAEWYNPYVYSSVIGMVKSKSLKYQKNLFKSDQYEDSGWLKKTFLWLKENI